MNLVRNPAKDIRLCRHHPEMLREPLLVRELAIHFEMERSAVSGAGRQEEDGFLSAVIRRLYLHIYIQEAHSLPFRLFLQECMRASFPGDQLVIGRDMRQKSPPTRA